MKIFGFYISRMDWEFLYNYERGVLRNERRAMKDYIKKHIRCQDCQQYKSNFKEVHDQLRAEVNKPMDWDKIRKAGM